MELRQLQFLIACAQTNSFSKAATTLFTTQSNVSKTIAALENELGKKLFERKQYGIELTEKGKQVYKYALGMQEFSDKILDCANEESVDTLRVSFQPSSWFSEAFCKYICEYHEPQNRYSVVSATLDEIINRISGDMDQLGFAYIEDNQLARFEEVFRTNHLGYYTLQQSHTKLFCRNKDELLSGEVINLIQGNEDLSSGILNGNTQLADDGYLSRMHVIINTNSDSIMRGVLQNCNFANIGPDRIVHSNEEYCSDSIALENAEQTVWYICIFRNDRTLEELPKAFLGFLKEYIAASGY